jgi:glycerol uptake operon antiterminator
MLFANIVLGGVSMYSKFLTIIQKNPIIAAVNNIEKMDFAVASPCKIIFLLTGNIINIKDTVEKCKKNNKYILVHLDLVDGLSKDEYALKYISEYIKPDGIITTRGNLIRIAKENGIFAIQRLFLLDSMSLDTGIKSIHSTKPEAIEILPGIMPKAIKRIHAETQIPLIAGGLIIDKEDAIASLNAGAIGISTSNKSVWYM